MVKYFILNVVLIGSGLPDETKAARFILKDFVSGRLIYCKLPPDDEDFLRDHKIWQSNIEIFEQINEENKVKQEKLDFI